MIKYSTKKIYATMIFLLADIDNMKKSISNITNGVGSKSK